MTFLVILCWNTLMTANSHSITARPESLLWCRTKTLNKHVPELLFLSQQWKTLSNQWFTSPTLLEQATDKAAMAKTLQQEVNFSRQGCRTPCADKRPQSTCLTVCSLSPCLTKLFRAESLQLNLCTFDGSHVCRRSEMPNNLIQLLENTVTSYLKMFAFPRKMTLSKSFTFMVLLNVLLMTCGSTQARPDLNLIDSGDKTNVSWAETRTLPLVR